MALLQISEPGKTQAPHEKKFFIGIDLGTTNSLVALIQNGSPTVPTTLEEELDTNPFLRESEPSIVDHMGTKNEDPVSRFAKIRALKDNF